LSTAGRHDERIDQSTGRTALEDPNSSCDDSLPGAGVVSLSLYPEFDIRIDRQLLRFVRHW
jgi:hypothetical protein